MEATVPDKKDTMTSTKSGEELDEGVGEVVTFTPAEEAAVRRKIDLYLMPMLWCMYLFSYADRTNIGNAKVAGMADDLKLSSNEYSLALVVFFISYVIFEIPSNLFLSKTRPSFYLSGVMIAWGVVTCCMGAVHSAGALLAVRFVLGILEAAFAPGACLLLSCWYKPDEQARRFAIFYSAAVLSGAFGGIVSGAITGNLNNAHGIAGWRWLFIVEGAATIGCALVAVFIIPDFPATWKRLSVREKTIATERLLVSNVVTITEDSAPVSSAQALRASWSNWRTWLMTVGYMCIGTATTMSYFYPTLVHGLGYTAVKAQYMVVPIYSVAFVAVIVTGFINDNFPHYRGLTIAAWLALSTTCAVVVCAVYNYTARYVLLVFLASGVLAANALSLAFASTVCGPMPQEVRAVSLATINAIANLAGIYGAYLFPAKDSPKYLVGFGVVAGLCALGVVCYTAGQVLFRKYPYKRG